MIENNTYELTALELDYQGKGICKKDNMVVFVPKMLPGEVAEVLIKKVKQTYAEGEVVAFKVTSADRFSDEYPPQATLYHLKPSEELVWQERITKETIKKISGLDVNVEKTLAPKNETNYRNKVTLHVKFFNDKLNIGVFENKSHKLNAVETDVLALPIINSTIKELNKLFKNNALKDPTLEHIILRTNGFHVMVIFVTSKKYWQEKEFFLENVTADAIYQNIKDVRHKNTGTRNIHLKGLKTLDVKLGDLSFNLYPQAFFQINFDAAMLMYDFIKSNIKETDVVIDAYAGVSSIGQYLAKKAKQVITIESNVDAYLSAKESIESNSIDNIELINDTVENALKEELLESDVIVFDPPKSGLNFKTVELLLAHPIKKIIYASCDLKSLSRDLMYLQAGYEIKTVQPVKMFYRTVENETVVVLTKK